MVNKNCHPQNQRISPKGQQALVVFQLTLTLISYAFRVQNNMENYQCISSAKVTLIQNLKNYPLMIDNNSEKILIHCVQKYTERIII